MKQLFLLKKIIPTFLIGLYCVTASAELPNVDSFGAELEDTQGGMIYLYYYFISIGGRILGITVASLCFVAVVYYSYSKFNECRIGRAEWYELVVLVVIGALLLVFNTMLINTSNKVMDGKVNDVQVFDESVIDDKLLGKSVSYKQQYKQSDQSNSDKSNGDANSSLPDSGDNQQNANDDDKQVQRTDFNKRYQVAYDRPTDLLPEDKDIKGSVFRVKVGVEGDIDIDAELVRFLEHFQSVNNSSDKDDHVINNVVFSNDVIPGLVDEEDRFRFMNAVERINKGSFLPNGRHIFVDTAAILGDNQLGQKVSRDIMERVKRRYKKELEFRMSDKPWRYIVHKVSQDVLEGKADANTEIERLIGRVQRDKGFNTTLILMPEKDTDTAWNKVEKFGDKFFDKTPMGFGGLEFRMIHTDKRFSPILSKEILIDGIKQIDKELIEQDFMIKNKLKKTDILDIQFPE